MSFNIYERVNRDLAKNKNDNTGDTAKDKVAKVKVKKLDKEEE